MTEKDERGSLLATVPNWVSAIAAAFATVAAIVFGVAELAGDDSDNVESVETTVTDTETEGPVAIGDADLRDVGDDVVRVSVPVEWDERRSYRGPLAPGETAAAQMPTHNYAAAEAADDTGLDFYQSSGLAVTVSTDLELLAPDRTSSSDEVLEALDDLFPFGLDCDPQISTRRVHARSYEGLLRDWSECGGVGARFTDGLLFAEDGSHFVYVQVRVGHYEWEAAVDELVSSIDVDVDGLDLQTPGRTPPESPTHGTTP